MHTCINTKSMYATLYEISAIAWPSAWEGVHLVFERVSYRYIYVYRYLGEL